jgi:putative pyruvate formate lyase activating enzyme
LPLVYNTSGYEREATLKILDGVVDVWLPDAKYADDATALRLSGVRNYVHSNRAALREMYRQTGPELVLDSIGIAVRGMIVRHMILPKGLAGTPQVLDWLARELSPQVYVSLMDQYFPAHRALRDPVLGRKTTQAEYQAALDAFDTAGLQRGWFQSTLEA